MSLESLEEELQKATYAVSDGLAVNMSTAAAVTWVAWEIIITFDQEVKYIWKQRFSLYQMLYLLLRYGTPVALLVMLAVQTSVDIKFNTKFCEKYLMWLGIVVIYPVIWGEALIVLRLYAMYGQSRKMLALFLFMYVGRIATTLYVIVTQSLTINVVAPNIPITGCISTSPTNAYLGIVSVTVGAFVACVFFSLTLYKFLSTVPRIMWRRARATRQAAPLVQLLLRDASVYLAALLMSEIALLTFTLKYHGRRLSLLGIPWLMAAYFIAGTRLVLNLRAEAMSGDTSARPPLQLAMRARPRARVLTDLVFVDPRDIVHTGEAHSNALSESFSAHQSVTSSAGLGEGASQG